MPQHELEQQILQHLADKLFTVDRIRAIVHQLAKELAKFKRRNRGEVQRLRREVENVRLRMRRHYEAIEAGAIDLALVGARLQELKSEESDMLERADQLRGPKQIPPHLLRTDSLRKVQQKLHDVFVSNDHGLAKRYLNFLLDRIEIEGDEVRLEGDTGALCSLGLASDETGTVNQLATVPPVDLSWLPGAEKIRTFAPVLELAFYIKPDFGPNGRPDRRGYALAFTATALAPAPEVRKETPPERARRFQHMLDSGQARSRADLARLLGCSRAWVTKALGAHAGGAQ